MLTQSSSGVQDRCRESEGTRIARVEQVAEGTWPTVLSSRLHERGRVVGRGLDCLYVCFSGNRVISLAPELVRVLDDLTAGE